MKSLFFCVSLVCSIGVWASCPLDFEKVNLCASLKWMDGPHLNKKSHFQLTFWQKGDDLQTPVTPSFKLKIYSWMVMDNGHSHGGPKMHYRQKSEGVFEVKDARFFMHGMSGYWQIRIDLLNEDKLVSEARWRVKFLSDEP